MLLALLKVTGKRCLDVSVSLACARGMVFVDRVFIAVAARKSLQADTTVRGLSVISCDYFQKISLIRLQR